MKQLAGDIALVALAGLCLTACATRTDPVTQPGVVRSHAPLKYEATVNSYFDFTTPPVPGPRKLSIGAPEASRCAISGSGGRYASWVVPVIYDTSAASQMAVASTPPATKTTGDKNSKAATKAPAKPAASTTATVKTSTSATPSKSTQAVPMNEVSVTGLRYFFWFSSETLSAVTRQADLCP